MIEPDENNPAATESIRPNAALLAGVADVINPRHRSGLFPIDYVISRMKGLKKHPRPLERAIQHRLDRIGYIYVLELEDDHFYVGFTNNPQYRITAHIDGNGSAWTKVHKFVRVLECIRASAMVEDLKTLEYMLRYTWQKVRGGRWPFVKLSHPPFNDSVLFPR